MRIFLFIIFLTSISFYYTQGIFKISQVVKVVDADQTVPAGKVWKVESWHQTQVGILTSMPITGCSDLSRPRPYFVDNLSYHHLQPIGNGTSSFASSATNEFPLWLKAGQTIRTSCPGDFLSVVEFNVLP